MKVLLLFPPSWHPSQPYLSLPSLTAFLRQNGVRVVQRDVNIELLDILLTKKTCSEFYQKIVDTLRSMDMPGEASRRGASPDYQEKRRALVSALELIPSVIDKVEYPSTVVAMTAEALTSPAPVVVEPATSTLPPPKPTFTSSPTLAPYEQYTIDYLRRRVYGGGSIEMGEIMEETDQFTRSLIRYPSDGLTIYGFMNIPKGDGPFPVILVLHGLAIPATYNTLSYTTEMADTITRSSYIVIHPNMRGHLPSDSGDNLFRVGVSIDVLNLIALVKSQG